MELNKISNRIHPLIAAAAISVMLVSLVGIAAMTGILPNSHSSNSPSSPESTLSSALPSTQSVSSAPTVAPTVVPTASQFAETKIAQEKPLAQKVCGNCGKVESVQAIQHAEKPSGLGIVAGAVLGGVLGNQVGDGSGRKLATVAGAVGGGYAGNEIEKRTQTTTTYKVHVRMDDGSKRTFPYSTQPSWNAGDRIQVVNGSLTARG